MTYSVIIPAYNASKSIERAIRSVQDQKLSADEVIIVDDGSSDDTRAKILAINDVRIKYIYQKNSGPATARNTGIAIANGEFIAFLDADDIWLPCHMQDAMKFFETHSDVVWFASAYEIIEDSKIKKKMVYKTDSHVVPFFALFLKVSIIQTSGLIIKRMIFNEVGYFVDNWSFGEDLNMWVRIGLKYPTIGYSSKITMQYIKTVGSLTYDKTDYKIYNSLKVVNHTISAFQANPYSDALKLMNMWIANLIYDAFFQKNKKIISYSIKKWEKETSLNLKIQALILLLLPYPVGLLFFFTRKAILKTLKYLNLR